jgi:anionic cell wall polymer biosynthesis LytR-Cps2A-Psr (LCP) family protein
VLSVNEEVEQVQKKFFTILLTLILLLISAQVFAAGTVTDINYGINRNNVLRFTIDVTEKAPYSISIDDKTPCGYGKGQGSSRTCSQELRQG